MNRKDLDALNELYLSVYSGEQLNEGWVDTPKGKRFVTSTGEVRTGDPNAPLAGAARAAKRFFTQPQRLTPEQMRASTSGVPSPTPQQAKVKPTPNPAAKPKPLEYNSKNLGDKQNAEFRAGGGNAAVGDSYTAADVVARGRAALKAKAETASGGSGGSNRPAPPKPSGPVLSKKDGVEGTGVGANFKPRAFTDAEKSRYSSVAAQNAARTSASSGAAKPAIGKLGNTSFERRTPTSAELRAAQKERAGGASPEKALQAAKLAGQTQKSNDILASGKVAALGNKSTVQGTQQQVKADNIVKSGAVAALKPTPPTPGSGALGNAVATATAKPLDANFKSINNNNKKPITPVKQESYEWPSAKTIRDIAGAYASIYEAKKKVDQDQDGDNDFADVRVARMIASGVPKAKAIAMVKDKSYNEEVELWVNELVEEGYDLSDYTWEDMFEIYLDEGIGSAIRGLFSKKKEDETPKPQSRGDQLRARYNVGPEKSDTSAKRKILNRAKGNAERAQTQVDMGNASQSYADKAKGAHNKYLKAGYSKYGADLPPVGRGNKARKRAAAMTPREIKEAYAAYEFVASYLLENNFASTVNDANVIINNMSEGWFESIMEDVGGNQYTPNPIGNAIKAGAGLAKKVLSNPTVSSTINQTLRGNTSSGGYSTKPGDGKPYKDGPLWDGGGPKTSPKPQTKKQPPMRDEPLW